MNKTLLGEAKEFLIDYAKEVITWIGICSATQQVLVSFMYDGMKHVIKGISQAQITKLTYIICFVGIIGLTIKMIYNRFKTEFVIKVKVDTEQKIIIKLGSYADNMEDVLNKANSENKESIFVIGINDEVNMEKAQKKGVHKAVMSKFYPTKAESEDLQHRVNKAFNKKDDMGCKFGEVGMVNHLENSQILFVVNSKFEEEKSTSILGPQPTDIIRKVFKTLEKQSVDVVQMPILSSTNVRCTDNKKIIYSVTIAEIIDEYFKELLNTSNIDYDLVLSLRKEDLKDNNISARDIVKFIEDLKPMYHIK